MFISPFIVISIVAITIAMYFKESFAKVIPSAIFSIVVVMYLGGLFNNLSIGLYFIYFYCLVSIIVFIYFRIKNDKYRLQQLNELIISPGFIIFLILFIAIYIYNVNASFSNWDEWTHWGPYVKDMYERNKFYNTMGHIATVHLSYPPFIQLFEFFYCRIVGKCNMQNIYRAYQLLCFSMPLMVFCNLKFNIRSFRNSIKIIFVMVFSILFFIFANRFISFDANPIKSIYADAFLGLSFGFFLINVIQFDFYDRFKFFNFVLSSIALVLSKQMGLVLFLLGFFIFFIVVAYNNKLSKEIWIKGVILFLIPILFLVSWKLIVFLNKITDQFDLTKKVSIIGLIDILFKGQGFKWQRLVITKYIDYIFHIGVYFPISIWYILFAFAFILISIIVIKKYKNKIVIVSIGAMFGFILYIFALLCLYLYTFSEFEATNLASLWRYLSTYIAGLVFFLVFVFIEHLLYYLKINKISIVILILSLVGMYTTIHFANSINYCPKTIEESDDYIYKKDFSYVESLPVNAKCLIVSQGDKGLLGAKFHFKYFDKTFVSRSFGKPIYDTYDIWTLNYTKDEMKEYVKGFDYIYFENTDDNFKNCYNDVFVFIPENQSGIYPVNNILK